MRSFKSPRFSLDASGGYAYVLEREKSRVQAFASPDGGRSARVGRRRCATGLCPRGTACACACWCKQPTLPFCACPPRPAGRYILSWGKPGSGEGETLRAPRDLAGTDDGSMIVLDRRVLHAWARHVAVLKFLRCRRCARAGSQLRATWSVRACTTRGSQRTLARRSSSSLCTERLAPWQLAPWAQLPWASGTKQACSAQQLAPSGYAVGPRRLQVRPEAVQPRHGRGDQGVGQLRRWRGPGECARVAVRLAAWCGARAKVWRASGQVSPRRTVGVRPAASQAVHQACPGPVSPVPSLWTPLHCPLTVTSGGCTCWTLELRRCGGTAPTASC